MVQDNDDTVLKAAKELGLGELAPEIYKDILQPAARQVGKELVVVAKVVSIALSPLSVTVWGYERFRDWLSAKVASRLSSTPAEDIIAPPMHLAGAVLTQLPFVINEEELRDMYANLLSSSMDKGKSSIAHVSFAHVIQQLSPDEAKLIKFISNRPSKNLVYQAVENKSKMQSKTFHEQFDELCDEAGIKNELPYVGNLLRLGLISADDRKEYIDESGSDIWGEHARDIKITEMYLTDFGQSFIDTCV